MHKKILSMILAIAMVVSMFAGIAITANAATTAWTIVSSVDEIVAGESYVILVNGQTASYNGKVSSKHLQTTSGWTFAGGIATANPEDIVTVTFEAVADTANAYYLKDSNGKYITATKAGSGGFALADTDAYGWTFAAGETALKACYNNTAAAAGIWSYNDSSFRSYAYTNASYQDGSYDIYLACQKEVGEGTCAHENTTTTTVDATCIAEGSTTVTCADCGIEISKEILPITDHNYVDGICSVCSAVEPKTEKFALVTNVADLAAGDVIIITSADATQALSTTQNSNNRAAVAITANEDGTIDADPTVIQHITLGAGTNVEGTLTFGVDGGYLYAASSTKNYLRTQETNDANGEWIITLSEATDEAPAAFTVLAQGTNNPLMRYNSSSKLFSCYAATATTGTAVAIYEKVSSSEGGEGEPPVVCEHTNTTEIAAVAATCTTAGTTAGVKCADCGILLSGCEEIPALGHSYVDGTCSACGEAEPVCYDLATVLNENDNVVIYYPSSALALTATASGSKLAGTAAVVADNKLTITSEMAIMSVRYVEGSETDFYLISNNTYLTTAATGNSLTFAAEADDYSIWYLEIADEASGLVYIHNRNAVYNGGAQSLEYYSGFTTYGTKTTAAYKFQLYTVAGEAPDCTHEWGEWAETTAPTCTEAGAKARTCTLCGEVQTEAVAATGHSYVYGETAITCSACDYSAEYTLSDIATVRAYTDANTVYYFKGVVTFVDGKNVYIQDATAAILLYFTNADAASGIVVGDEILVWDTITSFNGLIETTYTTSQEYVKIASDKTVDAVAATVAGLAADTTAEFQSEKVALNNVVISEVGEWSEQYKNVNYTVTDGTNTAFIYRAPAATAEDVLAVGTSINLTAIVTVYNGEYQLRVVDASDIEVLATCAHENTSLQNAVQVECTVAGYTGDTVCSDCGVVIAEGEIVPAPGHNYVDGYCEECGAEEVSYYYKKVTTAPEAWDGKYIIVYEDGAGKALVFNGVDAANTYFETTYANGCIPYTVDLEAIEVTVATMEGGYSINTPSGYMYHTGTSNGTKFSTDAQLNTIELSAEEGLLITSDTFVFRFNNGSNSGMRFRYYKSSSYTSQQPISFYVKVEGTIPACEHANQETQNAVEATCTEAGYTGDVVCLDCFQTITAGTVIEALGHTYSYVDNGEDHTATCACGDTVTEPHTYVDGACACGATESTEPEYIPDPTLVFNMNISAGADMKVVYTIYQKNLGTYTDFYLVVNKAVAGGEPVSVTYGFQEGMESFATTTTPAGAAYMHRATFAGVYAREMGDVFEATLYAIGADGNIYYSETNASSMKSYLTGKIDAESSIPELKTMCVDMLNYGAAAQLHFAYDTENLVNADLTDEQKAYATAELPEAVDSSATSGEGVTLRSSVSVKEKVYLNLTATYTPTDASALKAVICDAEGNVIAELPVTVKNNVLCQASYGEVGAKQMRQLLTATLYEGDKAVSTTITWSVESYVATVRANPNAAATQINMVNAMLTYGDAVAAYMTASGQ